MMRYFKAFITGNPGCGKTTLLKEISKTLIDIGVSISGFITEEVRAGGVRTGFTIEDLRTFEKKTFASTQLETSIRFDRYYLNMANFESIALNCFEGSKVILIDEIGKMEFYSTKFRNLLFTNIGKEITIIATLHRDYVKLFEPYGKIYYLFREKYGDIKEEILNNLLY